MAANRRGRTRGHIKQPHPTLSSGRLRYALVEHQGNGGRRLIGLFDNPTVGSGVKQVYRKALPRGSSEWYTLERRKRA